MIIDFHVHALPPAIKHNRRPYLEKDPAFAAIYAPEKARIATAADLISAMDRDGVDMSVIVNYQWSTSALCTETNDYILEMAAKYPKRLAGFCSVASLVDDSAMKEIERCAKAGARGIGELRPDLQGIDYTRKDAIVHFAALARKYKLIVLTHASEPVGHQYPGKGKATPEMLCNFIARLGDVPVVCAHWGGGLPFYTLMPEVRDALENVYFDTAASPFLYRPEIYSHMAQLIGSDRILLGSDYPVMPVKRIIDEIKNAALPAADTEEIFSTNACRLLGLKDVRKTNVNEPTSE